MAPIIFALVLGAALLHASWNALVKTGGDPFLRLAVVNLVAGLCALPALFLTDVPAVASWPCLFASVVIHHGYYLALAYGYRHGDLSHVYPIARGIAPPLVALIAWAFAGESPGALGLVAILAISGGILSLAFADDRRLASLKPVGFALATGVTIAGYTLADGLGGRRAGDVLGYVAWLFAIDALPFALLVAYRYRARLGEALGRAWRPAAVGGAFAATAYGLVIWAMTRAPMAQVSALRETSVIMAALIGTRLLREPFGTRRIFAASLVAVGIVLLQVGGTA
jgi:drug/metabolite transporter (DMT)-like permease